MIVRNESATLTQRRRFAQLRVAAATQAPPSVAARRAHLTLIEQIVTQHAHEIAQALSADFGNRNAHETQLMEIFPIREAARHARRNLARWMATERKPVAAYFFPAQAQVIRQPLGVIGIIVPWNYPVLLALQPLVGALAAGNRVMIKMSEIAPQTAATLARLLHAAFAEDHVRVELGDAEASRSFAALPFDHLLFTGSTSIGRSVMRAAANNLTPVTLELGGKSPVIVGSDAPIAEAAARIMSGKCRNAGQTCVAPDYLLLADGMTDAFVAAARRIVTRRYPALGTNRDYTSIVDDAHFDRLSGLIADAIAKGATVVALHESEPSAERATRMLPPMLVLDVNDRMRIMQEEIFGPLLPVRTYTSLDEAIAYVNARPHPLALYYFGMTARDIDAVLNGTISGGVCINDVVLQFAQNELPFGGIGDSGMGAYHGRAGFERFSHTKAIFRQAKRSGSALLEPPYGKRVAALLRILMR